MTLVEFISPIRRGKQPDLVKATLFWAHEYAGQDCLSVSEIREHLIEARTVGARKWNISDTLRKAGGDVNRCKKDGARGGWCLTDTGARTLRDQLGLATVTVIAASDVRVVLRGIQDTDAARFVEESVKCLEATANRAAVVFLWSGAIQTLRTRCVGVGVKNVNAEVVKHVQKARAIRKVEDLAHIKDSDLLKVLKGLGLIDKSQKSALDSCLTLRNSCGHPGSYWPKEQKVKAFIEDVVGIVWH